MFLYGFAAQTDGSSVFLPKIATLHNAKVDMKADLSVAWLIEYNLGLRDMDVNKPIGTVKVPCYLYHDNLPVDSRHLLGRSEAYFKKSIKALCAQYPKLLEEYDLHLDELQGIE